VKNGVPYDKAFTLPIEDVASYGIIFGEFEGRKFDWNRMRWEERK
jgi:hypothetical protein